MGYCEDLLVHQTSIFDFVLLEGVSAWCVDLSNDNHYLKQL